MIRNLFFKWTGTIAFEYLFRTMPLFLRLVIFFSFLLVNLAINSEEKPHRIDLDEDKKLDADELSHKKEGFYFNGLPLFSSDSVRGQGLGLRSNLFFNGKKTDEYFEYQPYQFKVSSQLYQSNQGVRNYFISIDSPYIFDTAFRWKSSLGWDYNPNSQYFGIGEKSLKYSFKLNSLRNYFHPFLKNWYLLLELRHPILLKEHLFLKFVTCGVQMGHLRD